MGIACCSQKHSEGEKDIEGSGVDQQKLEVDDLAIQKGKGKKVSIEGPEEDDQDEEDEEQQPASQRKEGKMVTKSQNELDKIAKARGSGHRAGVSAEVVSQDAIEHFVKPVYKKDAADATKLQHLIQTNEKMKVIAGTLSAEALIDVVNAMFAKEVKEGENVIKQGDDGDCLFICEEGSLDVFVARKDPDTGEIPEGKGSKVLTVGPGALFGELALMYSAPRAATVTVASSTAKLWALERDAFKMLLVSKGQKQFEAYQGYLKEVELLAPFNDHDLGKIADLMESSLFDEGEAIITQGEVGNFLYIVEDGTCSAYIAGETGEIEVKKYKSGEYFGEIALLTDTTRKATVRGTGEGCSVLSISKEDFFNALGPITEKLKTQIEKYPKYAEFLKDD